MRVRFAGVLALTVALAGLAGCERDGRAAADAKICTPFAAQAVSTDPAGAAVQPGGEAAAFDDCLHRWGYRLARTRDSAAEVAQAVTAACGPALSRWNQASLTQAGAGPDTAVSLISGKTNNTPAERFELAQGKALFYVVQARAGRCTAP